MGAGVSGDAARLANLTRVFARLATDAAKRELIDRLAATAVRHLRRGFDRGHDPYGVPWDRPQHGGRPLYDDGDLRGSFRAVPTVEGFKLATDVFWAVVHQKGRVITPKRATLLRFLVGDAVVFARKVTIPRRRMVPDAGPARAWEKAFEGAAGAYVRRAFAGV